MWRCKQCPENLPTRHLLLKHYKLNHYHYGQRHPYPCTHYECPCSFKTWNALKTHLNRYHVTLSSTGVLICPLCPGSEIPSRREYLSHINNHLKQYETITCVFQKCTFQTNIYGTYKSHKSRRHLDCTAKDFKVELVKDAKSDHHTPEDHPGDLGEGATDLDSPNSTESVTPTENLQETIIQKLATVLLKLEVFSHVPCSAIDGFLEELHFFLTSAVLPISHSKAVNIFSKNNLQVDQSVINELISTNNPLVKAIAKRGPLATTFKRKQYYRETFNVVEPVEYVLEKPNAETRRLCILKALCVYCNEYPKDLVKTYMDTDIGAEHEFEKVVLGVYMVEHEDADASDSLEDVGIRNCSSSRLATGCNWLCTPFWINLLSGPELS